MPYPDSPPTLADVQAGLAHLPGPAADGEGGPAPVFVLACGWRSGSTLLQRALMTDPDLVVWGEPLGRLSPLARLTELVAHLGASPPPGSFTDLSALDADPSRAWVANLFPGGEHLLRGLRAWLDTWLAAPAASAGRPRWGLKEVRLGAPDALVLHRLYPDARFVVLVRDPADCWRSLREVAGDWELYDRFPDRPVRDAAAFGAVWERLATSWGEDLDGLDPIRLRYEDLDETVLDELGREFGLDLDPGRALGERVGGTAREDALPAAEAEAIAESTRRGRGLWGYARAEVAT